jgi:hypothetical protein
VQVDPAPLDAVDAGDDAGRAPVGLLDPGLEEDHALETADDVAEPLQRGLGLDVEIDAVAALRDVGQQVPVLGRDRDHVVDARVVVVAHLGQAEVRALAGVARDDVVDDRALVLGRGGAQRAELLLGTERRVDLHADAVEMAVDRGREPAPVEPAGLLDRAGVDGVDADLAKRVPQPPVGERREERLGRIGDERERIGREPHRRPVDRRARIRVRERVLPHAALPGQLRREPVGVGEHRLLDQPLDVLATVGDRVPAEPIRDPAPQRAPRPRPEPLRARGIELLVVVDLRRLVLGRWLLERIVGLGAVAKALVQGGSRALDRWDFELTCPRLREATRKGVAP